MDEIKYRAVKYIRLSIADGKDGESNSIINQRRLIDEFLSKHTEIESVGEYVDDGVSGIVFDRPAFAEMMAVIREGTANCIISKDLSRLGRDRIETGRYLQRIFPAIGVRFIAINDNIDTLNDDTDRLIVSVKSILNDEYCRDISVKTRSALEIKRAHGDYTGACPVYGYRKDPNDHNHLVIDEYAANIIRDIFRMKMEGNSAARIATTLNELGVLSPLEYKKDRGLPYPKGGYADRSGAKWSASTIIRILGDATYTGTLIQGKSGTPTYKLKELVQRPEEEWHRRENAHEPVILRHTFDLVQKIMRLDTRTAPNRDKVYLFSGILMDDMVITTIKKQAEVILNSDDLSSFRKTTASNKRLDGLGIQPNNADVEKQIELLSQQRQRCYECFMNLEIDRDTFRSMKSDYTSQIDALTQRRAMFQQAAFKRDADKKTAALAKDAMRETTAPKDIVNALIDKVFIFPGNQIEIHWKFTSFAETGAL